MKQGPSKSMLGDTKVEPKSKAIGLAKVSDIGNRVLRTKPVQMYEGRGYEAPSIGSHSHKSGSQGKH